MRDSELKFAQSLFSFDEAMQHAYIIQKPEFVIGVDEVGRGAIAGPVYAGAVCFDIRAHAALIVELCDLKDSKDLSPQKRQTLASRIRSCSSFEVSYASLEEIESLNILHASLLAMKRAAEALLQKLDRTKGCLVLVDGDLMIPGLDVAQVPLVDGDTYSGCIAAASIIAKVARDEVMHELSLEYPGYFWSENSGYKTKNHISSIEKFGLSPLHRRSFPCLHKYLEQAK